MNVIIKSVKFKASDNLKAFITEKLKKLFRHSDSIIRAIAVLRKSESKNSQNKLCEIRLMVPGYDYYVKKSSGDYQKSVSQAVEALEEIIRRNKTRLLVNR